MGLVRESRLSDNPRFSSKAPNGIKSVDMIDGTHLHLSRILPFAQCRRDALHYHRRDAANMTPSSTVNMTTENANDPPRTLQSPAERRLYLRCLKLERVWPYRNLKGRVMRENRNRFSDL
jgi:hypothetical protein